MREAACGRPFFVYLGVSCGQCPTALSPHYWAGAVEYHAQGVKHEHPLVSLVLQQGFCQTGDKVFIRNIHCAA